MRFDIYGGGDWEEHFAWWPVELRRESGEWQWVWLKKVERRVVLDNDPYSIVYGYRLIGEKVDYTPNEVIWRN